METQSCEQRTAAAAEIARCSKAVLEHVLEHVPEHDLTNAVGRASPVWHHTIREQRRCGISAWRRVVQALRVQQLHLTAARTLLRPSARGLGTRMGDSSRLLIIMSVAAPVDSTDDCHRNDTLIAEKGPALPHPSCYP